MGVSKKGRRTLQYNGITFVWWVGQNPDDENRVWLNIVSEDKSIVLAYRMGEGDFFITSKGRMFKGKKTSGCWERHAYPMEDPPMVITPQFVKEVVAWAVKE